MEFLDEEELIYYIITSISEKWLEKIVDFPDNQDYVPTFLFPAGHSGTSIINILLKSDNDYDKKRFLYLIRKVLVCINSFDTSRIKKYSIENKSNKKYHSEIVALIESMLKMCIHDRIYYECKNSNIYIYSFSKPNNYKAYNLIERSKQVYLQGGGKEGILPGISSLKQIKQVKSLKRLSNIHNAILAAHKHQHDLYCSWCYPDESVKHKQGQKCLACEYLMQIIKTIADENSLDIDMILRQIRRCTNNCRSLQEKKKKRKEKILELFKNVKIFRQYSKSDFQIALKNSFGNK